MNSSGRLKLLWLGALSSSLLLFPGVLDLTLMPRLTACGIFLFFPLLQVYKNRSGSAFRLDLIQLSYLAYASWVTLSLFWAQNKSESLPEIAKTWMAVLVFLLCGLALRKHKGLFNIQISRIALCIAAALLLNAGWQLLAAPYREPDWVYRIIGLNGHKNLFASFLFLLLFFAWRARTYLTGGWKTLSLVCSGLIVLCILVLRSKAVWGALAAALVVYGLGRIGSGRKKRPAQGLVLLVTLLLLGNLFFAFGLQPLSRKGIQYLSEPVSTAGQGLRSESERLCLWDKTYTMIRKQPVTGVGAGNWQLHLPDATLTGLWRAEDLNYTFQRPHNDFLWVLSETGWIGFNLYLLVLALFFVYLGRSISISVTDRNDALLCLSFFCGYQFISFFDFPKERVEHLLWSSALLAIGWSHVGEVGLPKTYLTMQRVKLPIVLALLTTGLVVAVAVMRLNSERHVRRLYNARSSGNLEGVIDQGNKALNCMYNLDPTSVPVNWYIGNAYAAKGNYSVARLRFLAAYQHNPFNRNVLNDLGSAYSMTGNRDSAKWMYREALRISPRFDDPRLNLSALLIEEGKYREAKNCLDSTLHDSQARQRYSRFIETALKTQ